MAPPCKKRKRSKTTSTAALHKEEACKPSQLGRHSIEDSPTLGTHMFLLYSGANNELTTLHSDLLPSNVKVLLASQAERSPFCRLPDHLPEIVELYRLFLYTGKLYSQAGHAEDFMDLDDEEYQDSEWLRLAHAYLLGIALGDEEFANAAIDGLIEKVDSSDLYPTSMAQEIYDRTSGADSLRALLVDFHVWKGQGNGILLPHDDAGGPREFKIAVRRGLKAAGMTIQDPDILPPWTGKNCSYHIHAMTSHCDAVARKKS